MLWECTCCWCLWRSPWLGCSGNPLSFREGELGDGKESRVGETGRIPRLLTFLLAALRKNSVMFVLVCFFPLGM